MEKTIEIVSTVETFNPWWGCSSISPGCDHCPPERWIRKFGVTCWGTSPRKPTPDKEWQEPIKWNQDAKAQGIRIEVLAGDWCDWADDQSPDGARDRLWALIRKTPHLDWKLVTKRACNIARFLPQDWGNGYPNVSLGVSAENREHGLPRIDILRGIPAAKRFVQFAPLLEDLGDIYLDGINWVEVKREMFRHCRPMKSEWVKRIQLQCREQGVECFAKG